MSYVQRELERIARMLRTPLPADQYDRLYAAQQALAWATDPNMFRAPYDAILVAEVTDTPADSEDCSAPAHLPLS